jgi:hypothetical protein
LAVAWLITALVAGCLPFIIPLLPNLNMKALPWLAFGLTIISQLLAIGFALDLLAFCRNSFYRMKS